jgi:hypothetical protein
MSALLLNCWIAGVLSQLLCSSPLLNMRSSQLVGSTLLIVQMSALLLNCWIGGVLNSCVQLC